MKKSEGRYWELDFLRGIAIILMVLFHFIYDLNHIRIIYYKLWEGPFDYASKLVASVFFLLVGISLTISYNKTRNTQSINQIRIRIFYRGLKLIFLGMIITIISWIIIPSRFVIFGVLHCIGVSIILSIPMLSKKNSNLFLGSIVILFGILLHYLVFNVTWLIPLGFLPTKFFSIDFFPLFPWFGIVLVGIGIGHYLYPEGKRRFDIDYDKNKRVINKISYIGRHSLHIYFFHQPVLFLIIFFLIHFSNIY
jgi:uncharacterized membrane protein